MDRGLQERLAGAAVLVALGVWLIPWVLDGSAVSDSPRDEAIALKLPTPEEAANRIIRRQTIDLGADRGTLIKGPAEAEAAAADADNATTDAPPAAAGAPPAAAAIREDTAPPPAQPDERRNEQPAAPAPEPEIVAASAADGWMVQIGSFGNSTNARRQAERIGTYGHDARIYEFAAAGGRTMFRVRLGPLASRERAEATASSLTAHGFVAQVVAPE